MITGKGNEEPQSTGEEMSLVRGGQGEVGESMTLDEARRILQTVIATPEESLTTENLNRVGGYDIKAVGQAFSVAARGIPVESASSVLGGFDQSSKGIREGNLTLTIYKSRGSSEIPIGGPEELELQLSKADNIILGCHLPLSSAGTRFRQGSLAFADFRRGSRRVESGYGFMVSGFDLDKYRHIYRGIRWLAANLLSWDREYISPEDLDSFAKPPSSPPQIEPPREI